MARAAVFRRDPRYAPRRRKWVGEAAAPPAAPPAFETIQTTDIATSTTWTLTLPSGVVAGDVLVALLGSDRNTTTTVSTEPTGWATIPGTTNPQADLSGPPSDCLGFFYWKKLQAGDPELSATNPVWTLASASAGWGVLARYSGADGVNTAASGGTVAATIHTLPTITTTVDGCLLVAGAIVDKTSSTSPGVYWTPPAVPGSWTERLDAESATFVEVTFADLAQATQGQVSGASFASADGENAVFFVVALAPVGAGGETPKTLSDSGAGADTLSVAAAVTLADAGSGADALQVAAAVALADAGTAADAVSVALAITLPDSGTAADALQLAAAVPLAEVGAGSDSLSVAAAVTLADSGTATDAISVDQSVPKTLTDAGTSADALSVAAAASLADAGSGAEQFQVAAAVTLADAGSAADSISVSQAVPKTLTDAGAGADALTVAAAVPLADSGSGTDTLAVAQSRTLSDFGTADNTLAVEQPRTLSDAGLGTDVLRVAAALDLSDLGAAAENAAAAALLALADTGVGTDTFVVATVVPVVWAVGVATIQPQTTGEATLQLAAIGEGQQQ